MRKADNKKRKPKKTEPEVKKKSVPDEPKSAVASIQEKSQDADCKVHNVINDAHGAHNHPSQEAVYVGQQEYEAMKMHQAITQEFATALVCTARHVTRFCV